MSETKSPPLKGIKVIELGTLIAAPFCSRILAEFGAEVIKIEAPDGGDQLRQWRKMYEGTSLWWYVQARNKKSVTVNLRVPEGQEIVRKLALDADIVVENFRPGALEKWNLGFDALAEINPRLIMVRLSGYGQSGPDRDKPGFGVIGESMGGMRYVTGYADRPPVRLGISIGDSIAALYGVIGALMALQHRHASGRGQVVDVALYEAVFSMMESLVPEFDVLGFVRERAGNALPGIVPSNTYPTRDGKFVIIGANNDAIFKRLMTAMKRADLAGDPQLATNAGRVPRTAEIDGAIGAWTGGARSRRGAGGARRRRGAGGQGLRRCGHRQRRAIPRARHDRAAQAARRQIGQAAGHRAEAVRHAGRDRMDRAETGRTHRRGFVGVGLRCGGAGGVEKIRHCLSAPAVRKPAARCATLCAALPDNKNARGGSARVHNNIEEKRMARISFVCKLALTLAVAAGAATNANAAATAPSRAESRNMALVGYNDLQARTAYQPVIQRQGDRYIAYVGHHGDIKVNALNGQTENNGTSIVDVTDPKKPVYLAHIPGETGKAEQGGAQMVRICSGDDLPKGVKGKYYMLRVFGNAAHEIWDVTDPAKPSLLTTVVKGLEGTHKNWWECDTGIAYLVSGVPGWRANRMTQVFDLSDPAKPVFIRNFGLPGQEPGATGPVPMTLHGMMSTGPKGNRIYFGYGTNQGGILQIVDREKLLNGPKEPTPANLLYPQVSRFDMMPTNGAHTVFPLLGVDMPEYAKAKDGSPRDFIVITDEAIQKECLEGRQQVWFVDITNEKFPMGVSNYTVKENERQLLRARRPLRLAFVERGGDLGLSQAHHVLHVVQRGPARARCARPLQPEGDRVLHSGDEQEHRRARNAGDAARQGQRNGGLRPHGDPVEQRRRRRSRLHLRGRPRQLRHAHPAIDGAGARDCELAEKIAAGTAPA